MLFFEILRDLDLNETVSPWFSRIEPKPLYESTQAQAFWDVPVYAEHTTVRANRVDARIIDNKEKKLLLMEMICPWIDNCEKKEAEKMEKYGPLRFELIKRYPNYKIVQLNVIMDVLGGWSKEQMNRIFGSRTLDILKKMQKAVLSSSLNIARTFKVITK